jgi:hypothetical protein
MKCISAQSLFVVLNLIFIINCNEHDQKVITALKKEKLLPKLKEKNSAIIGKVVSNGINGPDSKTFPMLSAFERKMMVNEDSRGLDRLFRSKYLRQNTLKRFSIENPINDHNDKKRFSNLTHGSHPASNTSCNHNEVNKTDHTTNHIDCQNNDKNKSHSDNHQEQKSHNKDDHSHGLKHNHSHDEHKNHNDSHHKDDHSHSLKDNHTHHISQLESINKDDHSHGHKHNNTQHEHKNQNDSHHKDHSHGHKHNHTKHEHKNHNNSQHKDHSHGHKDDPTQHERKNHNKSIEKEHTSHAHVVNHTHHEHENQNKTPNKHENSIANKDNHSQNEHKNHNDIHHKDDHSHGHKDNHTHHDSHHKDDHSHSHHDSYHKDDHSHHKDNHSHHSSHSHHHNHHNNPNKNQTSPQINKPSKNIKPLTPTSYYEPVPAIQKIDQETTDILKQLCATENQLKKPLIALQKEFNKISRKIKRIEHSNLPRSRLVMKYTHIINHINSGRGTLVRLNDILQTLKNSNCDSYEEAHTMYVGVLKTSDNLIIMLNKIFKKENLNMNLILINIH